MANIRVGAFTESEWSLRHRRTENMVSVARGAFSGGAVPGGGVALFRAAEFIKDTMRGDSVGSLYAEALRTPFDRIVETAGLVPGAVADILRSSAAGAGFDQRTGRIVTDSASEGLVDSCPL